MNLSIKIIYEEIILKYIDCCNEDNNEFLSNMEILKLYQFILDKSFN